STPSSLWPCDISSSSKYRVLRRPSGVVAKRRASMALDFPELFSPTSRVRSGRNSIVVSTQERKLLSVSDRTYMDCRGVDDVELGDSRDICVITCCLVGSTAIANCPTHLIVKSTREDVKRYLLDLASRSYGRFPRYPATLRQVRPHATE